MTDPRFDLEEYHEDALGMRISGSVLLACAGLLWLFVFISIRDGSALFPAWAIAQTLAGFVLIGMGTYRDNEINLVRARMAPRELRSE